MYRRVLYQDDCILDTQRNKLIFQDEYEWSSYLEWIDNYPLLDNEDKVQRDNLLSWNQGQPHIENNLHTYYSEEGDKLYTDEVEETFVIARTIYNNNTPVEKLLFNAEGETVKKTIFHTDKQLPSLEEFFDKGNLIRSCKFDLLGKPIQSKEYNESGELILESYYYAHTDIPKYELEKKDNNYIRKEYYPFGGLRSTGIISTPESIDGEWTYYHFNGNIESTHTVKEKKLTASSTLYYEDGSLNFILKHD